MSHFGCSDNGGRQDFQTDKILMWALQQCCKGREHHYPHIALRRKGSSNPKVTERVHGRSVISTGKAMLVCHYTMPALDFTLFQPKQQQPQNIHIPMFLVQPRGEGPTCHLPYWSSFGDSDFYLRSSFLFPSCHLLPTSAKHD